MKDREREREREREEEEKKIKKKMTTLGFDPGALGLPARCPNHHATKAHLLWV